MYVHDLSKLACLAIHGVWKTFVNPQTKANEASIYTTVENGKTI